LLGRFERLSDVYGARLKLRNCNSVGPDAHVRGQVRIANRGKISIGARFRLCSEPVRAHLLAEGGEIDIGDDVSIGHGSGIASSGRIRIGSGSRLGAFVLAMDTDYHVAGNINAKGDIVPLEIGRDVSIGNRVTILKGSIIGDGARVLDGSVVSGVVAAGQVVEGVPARPARSKARAQLSDSSELRVLRVAQGVFRLSSLPSPSDGPAHIEAWDSLGALSFILALEEEFEVVISEDRMAQVGCLADAVEVIMSLSEPV
jgi:acetyltransferase-like isoleucine patch superfamily enzyme/acyl carrier protein